MTCIRYQTTSISRFPLQIPTPRTYSGQKQLPQTDCCASLSSSRRTHSESHCGPIFKRFRKSEEALKQHVTDLCVLAKTNMYTISILNDATKQCAASVGRGCGVRGHSHPAGVGPPARDGCRGGSALRPPLARHLLLSHVHRGEAGHRSTAASPQSQASQQVRPLRTLQDGGSPHHPLPHSTRGLHGQGRHLQCLPSRHASSQSTRLLPVHLESKVLPLQGHAFRPQLSSTDLHQDNERSSGSLACSRCPSRVLHRRHHHIGIISRRVPSASLVSKSTKQGALWSQFYSASASLLLLSPATRTLGTSLCWCDTSNVYGRTTPRSATRRYATRRWFCFACPYSHVHPTLPVPSFTPQGMLVSFESPKETRASITTAPLPVNSASDTSVCPVSAVQEWISRYKDWLSNQESRFLFLRPDPSHAPLSSQRVAKVTMDLMRSAGIDVKQFKAATKALDAGCEVDSVMKLRRWSSHSVFDKFYNRSIRVPDIIDLSSQVQ